MNIMNFFSEESSKYGLIFTQFLKKFLRKKKAKFSKFYSGITNCVCVKRIALSNRLYSSSRFCASWERNIELSHTWDFRHCQNVKSHSCYYATFSSPQKISSATLKNNSSVGGVLSKSSVILWSAVRKLYKFSVSFLFII